MAFGRTVVGEALGKFLAMKSTHADSQHTEAARTTTGSSATAEASTTTARKVSDRAQIARVCASQMRDLDAPVIKEEAIPRKMLLGA